jgi:hypothetical protein
MSGGMPPEATGDAAGDATGEASCATTPPNVPTAATIASPSVAINRFTDKHPHLTVKTIPHRNLPFDRIHR